MHSNQPEAKWKVSTLHLQLHSGNIRDPPCSIKHFAFLLRLLKSCGETWGRQFNELSLWPLVKAAQENAGLSEWSFYFFFFLIAPTAWLFYV